jgi:hypothetical protein
MKHIWIGIIFVIGYIFLDVFVIDPFIDNHKKPTTVEVQKSAEIHYYGFDGKFTGKMNVDSVVVNYKDKTIIGWYQKNIIYNSIK